MICEYSKAQCVKRVPRVSVLLTNLSPCLYRSLLVRGFIKESLLWGQLPRKLSTTHARNSPHAFTSRKPYSVWLKNNIPFL